MSAPRRTRALFVAVVVTILLGWAPTARAASMAKANEAFQHGDYKAAIDGYEEIAASGIVHEDLFYDLGNAYFRAGRLGPAIYNYERALRVDPDSEDALFNLHVARKVVASTAGARLKGAELDPWWVRLSFSFSLSHLTLLLLVCNALFFLALALSRFMVSSVLRTVALVIAVAMGLVVVGNGALLVGQVYATEELHQGIVVADLAIMREGPNEDLEERGQLHPGLRVRVLDERSGWLRIRLANGVEGWVPTASVGRF